MTTHGSPLALQRAPDEGTGARRPLARERAGARARATGVDLAWRSGAALLAAQLVLMVASSTAEYHRYDLTRDFSGYSQVWSSIAHGSLDPFSTIFDVRFWRNDLELVLWPLALVAKVFPSPISLLYIQDLAVVLAELVALAWVRDVVRQRQLGPRVAAAIMSFGALLLVVDPWAWPTIQFDFHTEPIGALFTVLAGRDLWRGRHRWLLVWVPLACACNAIVATYVLAVGVAGMLTARSSRRAGALVALFALGWLAVASHLQAIGGGGTGLAAWYGYLAGGHGGHVTILDVVRGVVGHPGRVLSMLWSRRPYVEGYVLAGGVLGLASPWGFVVSAVVILPSVLNADAGFLAFPNSFQSWTAIPFLVVGGAMVLVRLAGRVDAQRDDARLHATHLTLAAMVCVVGVSTVALLVRHAPTFAGYVDSVSPAAVARLDAVERTIPAGAEVVASQGVSGRFADGHLPFTFWATGADDTFPVDRRTVVFVFAPVQGVAEGASVITRHAIAKVEHVLHARALVAGDGIWAFEWTPPPGTRAVSFSTSVA